MEIIFQKEKETKNTVKFNEILSNDLERGHIGSLYILKDTLENLGFNESNKIKLTIDII